MPSTLQAPKGPMVKFRGGQPTIDWWPEAANQSFKVGDWVYLSTGKLTICAASNNDVGNIPILGRVQAPASGVADTQLPVEIADDHYEALFPMYHGTPSSAVTAITDVTSTLPLRNQGGIWCVNKQNDGTNDRILVTAIDKGFDIGEMFGFVWGKVIPANRQAGG